MVTTSFTDTFFSSQRILRRATLACLSALLCLLGNQTHAAEPATSAAIATKTPLAAKTFSIAFRQLGLGTQELRGVENSSYVNYGLRGDQVVTSATLRLRMTYSPSLLPELSHLRINFNQQTLVALPLPKDQAGREVVREVPLDARLFTDYNQLRFDLISHYTLDCEDPKHSSLWLTISPDSELLVTTQPLVLRNDLALLPAPFFDRRDNHKLIVPMLLPATPSKAMVHAAGMAASWLGMLADYRSARFPVSSQALPTHHALVFATNSLKPAPLKLDEVTAPTISMMDNPDNPALKLLVLQGKDDAQLAQAVSALVIGTPVFSGSRVTVQGVSSTPRAAYDAPRWLRSDGPVRLMDLVDSPEQLQSYGINPGPININVNLPPDLFTWNHSGVPVNLRYRYTAPAVHDNSLLNISINNQLLRSFRLAGADETLGDKLRLPLLAGADASQRDDLTIPALQLTSNNQLQFQFALSYHQDGLCREVFSDKTRQAIDPDSSIDISGFAHYTALPNLALFANAGFPFTRHADLAHTAIVIADMNNSSLEQLFFLLGRMGRHTGAVATHYTLLDTSEANQAGNQDLLILGGAASNRLLAQWDHDLSLSLAETQRRYQRTALTALWKGEAARGDSAVGKVLLNTNGSLGAFMSFASPLASKRTVVALASTDAQATETLLDALEDSARVARIQGDLAVVRGADVQSFMGSAHYYVGSLSWWLWLWFHLSRHPVLLTLVAIITAIAAALLMYGWLQQRHRRRMAQTTHE